MKLKVTETKYVEASPRLIAQAFWEMDNEQQAEFFDHLYNVAGVNFESQMDVVANSTDNLTLDALRAMEKIGKSAIERMKVK